jgi:5-methyltetrahydrofolate--homocysteine methyltransferase
MSRLLVKSTVVMRDNLPEPNDRGMASRWPILLGGAALTRAHELSEEMQLHPEQSTDAIVIRRPAARYFSVSRPR